MDRPESNAIIKQCLPLLSRDFPRWVIKKETDLPFTKSIIKEALRLEFLALKEDDKDRRTLLAICWMELSHFVASDDAHLLKRYDEALGKRPALHNGVIVERHPDAKPWEFTIKLSKNEDPFSEK